MSIDVEPMLPAPYRDQADRIARVLHPALESHPGHAKQAGLLSAVSGATNFQNRFVIVVDDDIDVSNLEDVLWALCTRSDPATSIDIIHNAWSTPLDPRIEPEPHFHAHDPAPDRRR